MVFRFLLSHKISEVEHVKKIELFRLQGGQEPACKSPLHLGIFRAGSDMTVVKKAANCEF